LLIFDFCSSSSAAALSASVPSKMLPPLACCTVDQEATAAGDSGFKFKDNGQHASASDAEAR
jgi:hypothetical protein